MAKPKLTVTISPTGEVKIDAAGFTGKSCLDATRDFEKWLGGSLTREMKPEGGAVAVPARQAVKGGSS